MLLPDDQQRDFASEVDSELLWSPDHSDYSHWIKRLTAALIKSGAVKNEVLRSLRPICHVKVGGTDHSTLSTVWRLILLSVADFLL